MIGKSRFEMGNELRNQILIVRPERFYCSFNFRSNSGQAVGDV
jgi:hypothetical protein